MAETEKEDIPPYTLEEAIAEAQRCLKCPKPLCRTGCPIENDIPAFNRALSSGNIGEAYAIISERSNLPAICGHICPHENQCQGHCIMNRMNKPPILIGQIERFIANFEAEFQLNKIKKLPKTAGKVAIIGSGPAGLSAAFELTRQQYDVTVYEKNEEAGGVLMYGIPAFRLPKDIVQRHIKRLSDNGVVFKTNTEVGTDITIDQLLAEGFDAVLIGAGAVQAKGLGLPGEDLDGVIDALKLLHDMRDYNTGKITRDKIQIKEGDEVVVIGAGNVAMDACRTAARMGARHTYVCYRRTIEFMKAAKAEYDEAVKDGVEFRWEHVPVSFEGKDGKVIGFKTKTPEGEIVMPVNKIIIAIGSEPNDVTTAGAEGVVLDDGKLIKTETADGTPFYGMTGKKGVFAAGDIVHGPKTVVMAMREGKRVANGVMEYIKANKPASDA